MKTKEITLPPFLRPGDTVGICAVARKVTKEEIEPAVRKLEEWGFYVELGQHLFGAENQYSGSDEERASDLQAFLDDPSVKAVISARGGYGTMRIIDRLDFTKFREQPKWITGYSDITVLHSHIHTNFSIATMHATMPLNFAKDPFSTETLREGWCGEPLSYKSIDTVNAENRSGFAAGQLTGGNLSLLYALQASASDIDTDGKILFLEDLDEYLYHIDRMMLSLKRAGKFDGLAGLIVGGMNDMKDNTVPFGKSAEKIIAEHVREFSFPVCYGFPAGHDVKNYALALGRTIHLDVNGPETVLTFV
ncbi:MAG TPA: LD-carboxypeptidase [Bacteroidia bacterium]|nr:LD-carboxypeptidase [Bacteroidia bacterium]